MVATDPPPWAGDQPGLPCGRPGASAASGTGRDTRAGAGAAQIERTGDRGAGGRGRRGRPARRPRSLGGGRYARVHHPPLLPYPFRDPVRVDAALLAELAAFCAQVPAWDFTLTETARFPGVL